MSSIEIEHFAGTERVNMATIAVMSMTHSDMEVTRNLVYLQYTPDHTTMGLFLLLKNTLIVLTALRSVELDEPGVPATLLIRVK